MGDIVNFLSGTKILEEVESAVNGKLTVVRDLVWGTYIKGGGLTQSGGVAKKVWRTSLKKVASSKKQVVRVLILGLGGGSIAQLVKKYWPDAKITGVDVDPVIIDLGKKYFGLHEDKIEIEVKDAYEYVNSQQSAANSQQFNLVCVDLYVGDQYPKKFEKDDFLKLILKLLTNNGVAVFNRLYYDEKRFLANKFEKKLKKVFPKVERIYPEANVMFITSAVRLEI